MGREKKAQEAKEALFKRLYGVKPATFNQMLSILQKEFNEMHKSGEHDFTVYKDTIGKEVSNSIPIDADLGYLGIKEYHANSFIPVKSSKKHQLTKQEKAYNKRLARRLVIIEHINGRIKVFKCMSYP